MALPNEEMDLARYKSAAAELDSPSRDEGLWIKAFAEAGGDEKATRAQYIKLRVEQLRRSAVADAARRIVGESTSVSTSKQSVSVASASTNTPSQAPSTPQGPARVGQTLYDIIGVDRNADAATISAAIQGKQSQAPASNTSNDDYQRRKVLLQHAEDVLLNTEKRQAYDNRVFTHKPSASQPQAPHEVGAAQNEHPGSLDSPESVEGTLVSPGNQLIAALIDWGVFLLPMALLGLIGSGPAIAKASAFVALGLLVFQVRLMRLGLTIGKGIMGMRVVDMNTHEAPSIKNGIVLHAVIPLSVMFAAGMVNDYLFFGLLIVDFLFVFGDERRCFHDMLADTLVVSSNSSGVHNTPDGTLARLQKAAAQGFADAQNELGAKYAQGDGVVMDEARAVDLYRKAAAQGHVLAQTNLGRMYYLGTGVPKDIAKGKEWIQKAAEQGLAHAQHLLGMLYSNGDGIPKDAAKAIDWHQRAAAQGHADAQNSLGMMYSEGDGIPKDISKAVGWFRKAAAQGYAAAQCNLGALYALGDGMPKDAVKAVEWYRKAAAQGLAQAQYYLGMMYIQGDGLPEDVVLGYAWLNIAAISNEPIAVAKRDAAASQLSKTELTEAQRLSSGWRTGQVLVRESSR
jgi:TPR repeat protein/uncharacterized RDD family membrane protein YckC